MKKLKFLIVGVTTLALVISASSTVLGGTGNGAPSGEHYTLNIIGVSKDKNANMDNAGGNVIFVDLTGKTKIMLEEGDDFGVLDKNGTDGTATFQLPDPGLDPYLVGDTEGKDTISDYSVFVRPLGKPGGYATITTCADLIDMGILSNKLGKTLAKTDPSDCSVEQVGSPITLRSHGKSTFTNVTAELLTIVFAVDTDGDTVADDYVRVPIFDKSLEGEYWDYDNKGLKVLQVRFYPGVQTDVSLDDGDLE